MTDGLAASCAELERLLPYAAGLLTQRDVEDGTDAMPGVPVTASRPPWNPAAATAVLDVHEGVRRLEASIRRDVTGHTGRRRGGSDANTMAAVKAIVSLSHAISEDDAAMAAAIIGRWARQIRELPAVDESEPRRKLHGFACPYCGLKMVYFQPRGGIVFCLRKDACYDSNDQHPMGRVYISELDAVPRVAWNDGLVTP